MAKRGVKAKEHEKLDDATIEKVISLLENPNPITKKEACQVLNISYNTTRLTNIIREYKEKKESRARKFKANRRQPLSEKEIGRIIEYYLSGDPTSTISEYVFRPTKVVKNVLDTYNVPIRPVGDDKHKYSLLPASMIRDFFEKGSIVWSAKYHAAAEIIKESNPSKDKTPIYQIYVFEASEGSRRGGFYAYQRVEDLGDLSHLEKFLDTTRLTKISA